MSRPTKEQLQMLRELTKPPRCTAQARKALQALLDHHAELEKTLRQLCECQNCTQCMACVRIGALALMFDLGEAIA